jgi:AraC-like DNA-binding protein
MTMRIERHAPDPRLTSAVTAYQMRTADLTAGRLEVPLPARTNVIMEFYFSRPHLVHIWSTGERERAPWAVAVGPQTFRRVDLIMSDTVEVFTVQFQPTGLSQVFGISMSALTNEAVTADNLLGASGADALHGRLQAASTLAGRAAIMDAALLGRLRPSRADVFAAAAARLQASDGAARLHDLEADSGLSPRQFRRAFKARIGASPKLYGRIVRLNAALDAKMSRPATSWTAIAHRFGWFDQAHLDKDFLDLAGGAPTDFFPRVAVAR